MSRTKTFGEYLVEQGLLTTEELAHALVTQIKALPSATEIVFQSQMISAPEFIRILSLQSEKKIDFISACKELGQWNDEVNQNVWNEIERRRVPIVQILMLEKKIGIEQINQHLDSYLSELQQPAAETSPPSASTMQDIPVAVLEFDEQFRKETHARLRELLSKVRDSNERSNLIEMLHRLAGAAKFAGLERLHGTFAALDSLFQSLQKKGESVDPARLDHFAKISGDAIESAWKLKSFVLQTGTENGFGQGNPADDEALGMRQKLVETELQGFQTQEKSL